MTERMKRVMADTVIDTAGEDWHRRNDAWYAVAAAFAAEKLGPGRGDYCLVIGSPVPEVHRLRTHGWNTLYVDVRKPPEAVGDYVIADATALPFADETFDAVSTTCVLCHAGLGRYGDPVKANGDATMMREISRVLKPGGSVAMMAGPALPDAMLPESVVYGNVHRIYRPKDVEDMAKAFGLDCEDRVMCSSQEWSGDMNVLVKPDGTIEYAYLSVFLRKGTE